jgi:hypothetical protein
MILYFPSKSDGSESIERVAANMVEQSMLKRESVCSIFCGIPLVTYPYDRRPPPERIKNLILAFTDGWMRSKLRDPLLLDRDTRFDPKFDCEICAINASRERVLRETLATLSILAMEKLPDDEEIAVVVSASATLLQLTEDHRSMVEKFREILKP